MGLYKPSQKKLSSSSPLGGTSPSTDALVLSTLLGELNVAQGGTAEMMEALVTDAWPKV